jgi:hypothetical protein
MHTMNQDVCRCPILPRDEVLLVIWASGLWQTRDSVVGAEVHAMQILF